MTNLEAILICVAIWFYVFGYIMSACISINEYPKQYAKALKESFFWPIIVPYATLTCWKEPQ